MKNDKCKNTLQRVIETIMLNFKAKGMTLDIKMQTRWKYEDTLCTWCNVKEESGEELLPGVP